MTDDGRHNRILFLSAALVLAALIAYEPIRRNGFVNFDDPVYINNPIVTGGLTSKAIVRSFIENHGPNWHPLTTLTHILDYRFFGFKPLGHHLISLLFHIANTLLIFWILTKVTGAIWPGAFVAAVFALHPIQVESVAWVAERKTVVSGFFWLLTIAVYIWYTKRPGVRRYVLLFLIYGVCIMTKPIVVTLPLVLFLLDYWPLKRFGKSRHTKLLLEKVPLLALSGFLSIMTFVMQQRGGAVRSFGSAPLIYRIDNAFLSYFRYIGKIIWPSRLAVFYPYPDPATLTSVAAACILFFILVTVLSIYIGRQRKYVAVGWLWFIGTLVPVIGLIQVGSQAMADRYMYMSMVGLLIIVAWAVSDIVAGRPVLKVVSAILAAIVILSMIILTRIQVGYWQNSISLFEHTLNVTQNNPSAENSYGNALSAAGRFNEAQLHLSNAVRLCPSSVIARINLGKVLIEQGKTNEAIACFNELLQRGGKPAEVHYYLAVALGMQEKYDEAIKHLTTVLELAPGYPDASNKMGISLLSLGRPKEAIKYLKDALQPGPDQWSVYENLGIAYLQTGEYEQAIINLTKGVELKPDSSDALNELAWMFATGGKVSTENAGKAIEYALRACELTEYKNPLFIDTLSAAYAQAGRFNDAISTAKRAIEVAKTAGRQSDADEIQKRLELYQSGKPYRQK